MEYNRESRCYEFNSKWTRTPFKVHAVPGHMKVAHGKRKLAQVNNEVSKRLATILNVQQSEFESTDNLTCWNDERKT